MELSGKDIPYAQAIQRFLFCYVIRPAFHSSSEGFRLALLIRQGFDILLLSQYFVFKYYFLAVPPRLVISETTKDLVTYE